MRTRGGGRFQLRTLAGAGGSGRVHAAFDRRRRRQVALKELHPGAGPEAAARLRREFRLVASCHHRNLVRLHELGEDAEGPFLVMEWVSGVSARRYLELAPDPHERALRLRALFQQLLQALAALHAYGLVHRDLKPANVRVDESERVVLLDCGLAVSTATAHEERPAGTPGFAAPELHAGAPQPASDLYGLGALLLAASGAALREWPGELRDHPGLARLGADLGAHVRQLLDPDPQERPSAPDLLARQGIQPAPPAGAPPTQPSIVGRDVEEARLDAALAALGAAPGPQQPVLLVLEGPSGIGKSALLQRWTERLAAEERAVVLAGHCDPRESVPFQALSALVDRLCTALLRLPEAVVQALQPRYASYLAHLFPAFQRVPALGARAGGSWYGAAEMRRRGVVALRDLLARLATQRRIVLWIDDAQWGDPESARLLEALLRPPDPPPLLLVLSLREDGHEPGPLPATLEALRRSTPPGELLGLNVKLGPLDPADARLLFQQELGDEVLSPAERSAWLRQAGGSPYLLGLAARLLRGAPQAQELEGLVAARLEQLPPGRRRVLELCALAESALPRAVLLAAAELGPAGEKALEALVSARLLRRATAAERVETYHDRVRQAVLTRLEPAARRSRHRRLARAYLRLEPDDVAALRFHHEAAGEPGEACRFAALAGDEAMRELAFERAARCFAKALALEPPAEEVPELRRALAEAHAAAGQAQAAARELLAAAGEAEDAAAFRDRQRAAELFLGAGALVEGRRTLARVLGSVGMRLPRGEGSAVWEALLGELRLRLRGLRPRVRSPGAIAPRLARRIDACWTVAGSLGALDPVRAFGYQKRHLLLALSAGDPLRLARALALESVYMGTIGPSRRVKALERAIARLEPGLPAADRAFLAVARAYRAFHAGSFAEAEDGFGSAERLYARLGAARWERNLGRIHQVFALLFQGKLAAMRAADEALAAELQATRALAYAANLGLVAGYMASLAADDPAGAEARVQACLLPWPTPTPLAFRFLEVLARTGIALYRGEAAQAHGRLRRARRTVAPIVIFQSERILLRWLEGLCALGTGAEEVEPDLKQVEACRRAIAREGTRWGAGLERSLAAGLAWRRGRREQARACAAQAARRFHAAGMQAHAAASEAWWGELEGGVAGAARSTAAREHLTQLGVTCPRRWLRLHRPEPEAP